MNISIPREVVVSTEVIIAIRNKELYLISADYCFQEGAHTPIIRKITFPKCMFQLAGLHQKSGGIPHWIKEFFSPNRGKVRPIVPIGGHLMGSPFFVIVGDAGRTSMKGLLWLSHAKKHSRQKRLQTDIVNTC